MHRLLHLLDRLIGLGLILVLVFTVVAFGAVEEWARALGQTMIWIIVALWVCKLIWTPRWPASQVERGTLFGGRVRLSGLELPALAFVVVLLLQLVPLPPKVIRAVSPRTAEIYAITLPGYGQESPSFAAMPRWMQSDPEARAGDIPALPPDPEAAERAFPSEWFDVPYDSWRPLSLNPSNTRRVLWVFLAHLALFVVAFHRFDRRDGRSVPVVALGLLAGILAAVGILQHLTAGGLIYWFRGGGPHFGFGPFVNANHYAGWMELVLPLAAALTLTHWYRSQRDRRKRPFPAGAVVFGFITVLGLAAFGLAQSRGGILSLSCAALAAVLIYAARGGLNWKVLTVGLIPVVLAAGLAVWIDLPGVAERYGTLADPGEERSLTTRIDFSLRALRIARDFPVLGSGLGTFREVHYFYTPGTSSQELVRAHNDYAQLAAESGTLGVVVMLWALALIVGRGVAGGLLRRRGPGSWVVGAAAVGVLSLLLHSLMDFNLQIYSNSLLFVFLCALLLRDAAARRSEENAA